MELKYPKVDPKVELVAEFYLDPPFSGIRPPADPKGPPFATFSETFGANIY